MNQRYARTVIAITVTSLPPFPRPRAHHRHHPLRERKFRRYHGGTSVPPITGDYACLHIPWSPLYEALSLAFVGRLDTIDQFCPVIPINPFRLRLFKAKCIIPHVSASPHAGCDQVSRIVFHDILKEYQNSLSHVCRIRFIRTGLFPRLRGEEPRSPPPRAPPGEVKFLSASLRSSTGASAVDIPVFSEVEICILYMHALGRYALRHRTSKNRGADVRMHDRDVHINANAR